MESSRDRDFPLSYDKTTKILTAAVCFIVIAIPLATRNKIAGFFTALVLLAAYAWSPRGYKVSDGILIVRRLAGNVRVPLSAIREARRATAEDLSGAIRIWGSGGFFGYYGIFRTSKLGTCHWYVTNRANAVVVVADRTMVFSPDDVDAFLGAISEARQLTPPRR